LRPIFSDNLLKKWGLLFMCKVNLKITIVSFSLLFLLSGVIFIQSVQSADYSFQKGISYVTWEKERYSSPYSDESLKILAQTGAEWVAIVTTYYQDKYNSKEILPTEKTPSDKSLIYIINQAHQLGLKVILKPHIDLIDKSGGLWRGDIGFQSQADWEEWFSQYLKFILHYARLAEKTHAELLCIGTELSFASGQTVFWQKEIIPQIRKVYKGQLIYAANWDEYKNIRFWSSLDYVGINAYFPLAQKRNPGYEEIRTNCIKWADEIEMWQKEINKPVIITEIGYCSGEFAAAKPWENSCGGEVNLRIQADCYSAVLDIFCKRPWCKGIYWWYWKASPYAGGLSNRDFTPQNKPAEIILSYYYRGPFFAEISR
jgi:hypothetical protein